MKLKTAALALAVASTSLTAASGHGLVVVQLVVMVAVETRDFLLPVPVAATNVCVVEEDLVVR